MSKAADLSFFVLGGGGGHTAAQGNFNWSKQTCSTPARLARSSAVVRPLSGQNRPNPGQAKFDPAKESYDLVCQVAEPFSARDSVKSILNRAAERLGAHGLEFAESRIERAWKGRAGWRIYEAIKQAFDDWEQSSASRSSKVDLLLAEQLARLEETVSESGDPDFYRPAIEALRAAIHARGGALHPRIDVDRASTVD